ncbi:MAG: DMT family transporter [bacterium]
MPGGNNSKPVLLLVATAVLWSLGGLLIKLIDANPLAIAGIRSLIASVVIVAFTRNIKIKLTGIKMLTALSYAGMVILFVTANKFTTAANAILLQYTAPVYVAILAALILKERTKMFDWIIIVIVLSGMTLFFFDDLTMHQKAGNLIAIASGVCMAFFIVLMRMQKDGKPVESVLLGNVLTVIIGLPFIAGHVPNVTGWLALIVAGVFQLGISYILFSIAIKKVTALEAILIPIIEPILNPIWVLLIIKEVPSTLSIIGGVIVISAVTLKCLLHVMRKGEFVPS